MKRAFKNAYSRRVIWYLGCHRSRGVERQRSATWSAATTLVAETKQPPGKESLATGPLPEGHLFKPLLADPRWPHFSAAYHYYIDNLSGAHIATVSFGETIPFYRGNLAHEQSSGQRELGLQAGVFSDFDLNAPSHHLVNADYFGGLYSSFRVGRWSAFGRLFHESSHLGDEFLLRTWLQRLNLSYEGRISNYLTSSPSGYVSMAEAVVCSTGNLQTSRFGQRNMASNSEARGARIWGHAADRRGRLQEF